jgi:hypothetical protein
MAQPLHRHQASLESVIDPSATPPLSPDERTQALSIFQHIIKHFNSYELLTTLIPKRKYERGKLLKLVYDYAISDHGRDNILRYFLTTMTTLSEEIPYTEQNFSRVLAGLADFKDRSALEKDKIVQRVQELADHLIDGFFLPRTFSGAKVLMHNC